MGTSREYEGPFPVTVDRVLPLRRSILRPGQPLERSVYPDDEHERSLHLAVLRDTTPVAVGSLFPEEGWRIRGMATLPEHRGRGLGGAILDGLLAGAAERGGGRVWCNARTDVAGFYRSRGFVVEGAEFEIPHLGPHLRMSRIVEASSRTVASGSTTRS